MIPPVSKRLKVTKIPIVSMCFNTGTYICNNKATPEKQYIQTEEIHFSPRSKLLTVNCSLLIKRFFFF